MTENEIIKGCLKNNRESQKALYELYYMEMLGVCLRYSKDDNEAQEILQEGFLKVFLNNNFTKPTEPIKNLIKDTIINTAIDYLHKNKQNLIVSTFNANKVTTNKLIDLTDEEIVLQINKDIILKAVQELPSAYRKVYNLYVIEGFTHKKIAEMLDISENTSETNLSKAKFNLRQNLLGKIKISDGNE